MKEMILSLHFKTNLMLEFHIFGLMYAYSDLLNKCCSVTLSWYVSVKMIEKFEFQPLLKSMSWVCELTGWLSQSGTGFWLRLWSRVALNFAIQRFILKVWSVFYYLKSFYLFRIILMVKNFTFQNFW